MLFLKKSTTVITQIMMHTVLCQPSNSVFSSESLPSTYTRNLPRQTGLALHLKRHWSGQSKGKKILWQQKMTPLYEHPPYILSQDMHASGDARVATGP